MKRHINFQLDITYGNSDIYIGFLRDCFRYCGNLFPEKKQWGRQKNHGADNKHAYG